jgi:hypothetical protein
VLHVDYCLACLCPSELVNPRLFYFSAPSLNHLYIVVPYVGVTFYAASIWMFVRRKCWCFPSLTRDWPCSETWKNAVLQAYIEIAIVLVRCINWLAVGRGERFFLRSLRTLHSPSSSAKLALVAGIHDVSKHATLQWEEVLRHIVQAGARQVPMR